MDDLDSLMEKMRRKAESMCNNGQTVTKISVSHSTVDGRVVPNFTIKLSEPTCSQMYELIQFTGAVGIISLCRPIVYLGHKLLGGKNEKET